MSVEERDPDALRAVIRDAQAALERIEAVNRARTAAVEAVEEYADVTGCSVADAWRDLCPLDQPPAPGPGPVDAPEWVQPAGAHDAYSVGDLVTYKGAVYESTLGGNSWSPAAYPQGWRKL